ncbi:MAG: hypothetical protein AAGI51_02090 [Pseudomonadota bacterium]
MSRYPDWVVDRLIENELQNVEQANLVLTWKVGAGVPDWAPPTEDADGYYDPAPWEVRQMRHAADIVEATTGVRMIETDSETADLSIHIFDNGGVLGWAHARLNPVANRAIAVQRVNDDLTGRAWFEILLHEIGHILGIKHPFEAPMVPERYDDNRHTLMTYNMVAESNGKFRPLDIEALSRLYGRSFDHRARLGEDGSVQVLGDGGDDRMKMTGVHLATAGPIHALHGRGGDDRLDVVDGAWSVKGGGGADRIVFSAREGDISGGGGDDRIELRLGDAEVEGGAGDDRLFDRRVDFEEALENAESLGDLIDLLPDANATFDGGAGNDRLEGGAGDDTLSGGAGKDVLRGGDDADVLDGGGGADRLIGGAGDDALSGGQGADRLDGGEGADRLDGGGGGDALRGGAGDDMLSGGRGADRLFGGDGADVLNGGAGVDALKGDAEADVFVFAAADLGAAPDVVADFEVGVDVLAFSGLSAAEVEVVADGGASVVRTVADQTKIVRLKGVDATDVNAARFDFSDDFLV